MQPRPGGAGEPHGSSGPRCGAAAHLWLLVVGVLLGNGCSAPDPRAVATVVPPVAVPATPVVAMSGTAVPQSSVTRAAADASATRAQTAELTAEPTATPSPTLAVFSLAAPRPLPDLGGRIVWVEEREEQERQLGSVVSLELASGRRETLWEDALTLGHWAVAPTTGMAAYITDRDGRAALVVRELAHGAEATVVVLDEDEGTTLAGPSWHPNGRSLGYAVAGSACYDLNDSSPCAYRVVDAADGVDEAIWSGQRSAFPYACDCDFGWNWEPASSRVAVFEHPFESTFSRQLSLVESGSQAAIGRYDVANEFHARAQSADRVWIALVDSASYYGSLFPLSRLLGADPERWPGESRVRLFNIQTGGILDLGGWESAVGFTQPIWSPDGAWLAFAEPTGPFLDPTPVPTATGHPSPMPTPMGYPPPQPAPDPVGSARGEFQASGTTVWALSREGRVLARIELPHADALPVAVSPSAEHLLIAVHSPDLRALDVHAYRVSDGVGGFLATIPSGPTRFWWLP